MATKPVVVYGASGYTGRLICEYLREYNVPFVAAGRDAGKIEAAMRENVAGIETADYEIVEVGHDTKALTELFAGSAVVCNTVGPFSRYGPEVVEACLAAGAHYLDTTGEQDWLITCDEKYGADFASSGLLLAPGVAQMYTTGEIAAELCLEKPGLDTLDIAVFWGGSPTIASTLTILVNAATAGAYRNDPRVANVKVLGGVFNRALMNGVPQIVAAAVEATKDMQPDERYAALTATAAQVMNQMPPRENPRLNKSVDSVHASGPLGRAHCVIYGNSNYKQTGLMQAYAAYHLLQRPPRRVGFASGCQAFGHRELLGVLESFGLVREPTVTVER
jgi:hypothetical protein